jgi:predicted transcriptional regulator
MYESVTQHDLYEVRINIGGSISEFNLIGIIMSKSSRSKHEIFSDILSAIDTDGVTINEIQFKTYISYQRLKQYLTVVVQHELIVYSKEEKRFRITSRGIQALDMYTKMDELLGRKTPHKMTNTPEYFTSFP